MSIQIVPLKTAEIPCGYFPEKIFTSEHFLAEEFGESELEWFLERGYRHFGAYFFRPRCTDCGKCIPLRVRVSEKSFSRSAKRLFRRNSHLRLETTRPRPEKEAFDLYKLHKERFGEVMEEEWENFIEAFYFPSSGAYQNSLYDGDRLICVSHFDETEDSLSAVYTYYDDSYYRESLGTFAVYLLLRRALVLGKEHLYLGYYIRDNRHMAYKARFRPNEILLEEGRWEEYIGGDGMPKDPELISRGFHPREDLFNYFS